MYLALKAGKTSMSKRAQWLQLAEAYSTTFTLAFGLPRLMSPSAGAAPPPPPFEQAASARPATTAAAVIRRRLSMRGGTFPSCPDWAVKRDSREAAQLRRFQAEGIHRR